MCMMQVQQQARVALGDVTTQINNRANRFEDHEGKKAFANSETLKSHEGVSMKENNATCYASKAVTGEADQRIQRFQQPEHAAFLSSGNTVNTHSRIMSYDKEAEIIIPNDMDDEDLVSGTEVVELDDDDDDRDTDDESIDSKDRGGVADDKDFTPLLPVVTENSERLYAYVYNRLHRDEPDAQDEDTWDPVMVSEYTTDIFKHLRFLEVKFSPNPRYMKHQPELTWNYRSTLIDWIVQVHDRFQLLPETLFLCINIVDRFLSKRQVTLNRLQLVGAAALFIAAKYEEINCPTLKDMLYMLDNAYSREEVLRAERFMINTLNFEFGWPGPMSFLRRVSKADDYEYDTRTIAKYLLETSIMEPELVAAPPSWLAAGAYYLSKIIIGITGWSDDHVYYSGYTEEQLIPLATMILDSCRHASTRHKSILEKYSRSRHRKSALVVSKWISIAESRLQQK